jgi:hypothetical protein
LGVTSRVLFLQAVESNTYLVAVSRL